MPQVSGTSTSPLESTRTILESRLFAAIWSAITPAASSVSAVDRRVIDLSVHRLRP